jgi:V/A-type H+/Na+-transporting ATPase subunit I
MLKPHDMSRVIITGPKPLQEKVIRELHKLKILHIVEHSKSELADIGDPLVNANKLSELIVKVRSLITALGIKKEETEFELKGSLAGIERDVRKLNDEVSSLLDELKRAEDLLSKNEAAKNELNVLKDIDVPLQSFSSYRSLAYFTGYLGEKKSVEELEIEISQITKKFKILNSVVGKRKFVALFVDVKNKESTNNILRKMNFSPINFLNIGKLKGNAKDNLTRFQSHKIKAENLKARIDKQIEKLANEFKGFLLKSDEFLSQELEKAEAPLKFAATKNTFLVKGWVTTEQLDDSVSRLNKISKGKIFIHSEDAKGSDDVPIKLNNKSYVKPFEFFINMYSLPKYKEIDPTFFMFLTYPIFFGFMLGDFGYGIVSFALFYFLKKKMSQGAALFNVLLLSSASSILFGLMYGEVFGLEQIGHFHIPHLISRSHGVFELMFISVGIGVFHVNWGLTVGFINVLRGHGLKHAIFEKGSWFVLQIGILFLILSSLSIVNVPSLIGWLFFAVSLVMLYKGEGIKGIIELPSILTNTLSYLRLMAIGLSSVSIAVVVNEMAAGFFQQGGLMILSGVVILLIGHLLNILLGLFGSFLHSLRLHYVEFFSKFFEGGAEKYRPFGLKE